MNAMKRAWPAVVALAVPWWPAWAQTQTPTPPDNPALSEARQQWREANERVGEFPRGHIDLLKWEQRHLPPAATPARPGPALTADEANHLYAPKTTAMSSAEIVTFTQAILSKKS